MRFFVRLAVSRADAVIVICPELVDLVRSLRSDVPVALIENLPVTWDMPSATDAEVGRLRDELSLGDCRIALYTGTMGANQGLELAIEAMAELRDPRIDLRLVLVGGSEAEQERLRRFARSIGNERAVVFAGSRPPHQMSAFMQMADVLVSPRVAGTNTPLKVYSYLAAGRPIVATDLHSHRQTLGEATALLVEPRAAALAAGLRAVLEDPALAHRLAEAARSEALSRFAISDYRDRVAGIFAQAIARPERAS
jgi:glycosyltransferase involved in cell wall biosynthesis